MLGQVKCEKELRELLARDREAFLREYRIGMHLHGDPSDSENTADEEMIRALCEDQPPDGAFQTRRHQWEKTV